LPRADRWFWWSTISTGPSRACTIHALLAARLDRLPGIERAVLQHAAVQGRLFDRGALADLLGSGASGLGATLLALARKGFVRPEVSSGAGDDAFRFNHSLIRDIAYASLTKESRAQLHAILAAWLERREAARATPDEIVGHHLEQAFGYRRELGRVDEATIMLGQRAGELLAAAGLRALDRGEAAVSASLLSRAAGPMTSGALDHAGLLCALAAAQRLSGVLEAAEQSAEQAIAESRQAGDALGEQRARIEHALAQSARTRIEPALLRSVARRAIDVFEQHGSQVDLADAWQLMGTAELAAGDRRAQLQALRRGQTHAIASGNVRRQIHAWNEVGGAMLFGRTPISEVLAFLDEELAWAREHGLAAVEADALLGGPYLYSRLGRFDEARERLERSKALWRELGLRYELSEAHSAGAQMELLAGDPAAAERELRAAIDTVAGMGSARYEALYRMRLIYVLGHVNTNWINHAWCRTLHAWKSRKHSSRRSSTVCRCSAATSACLT
jgi:predicted ATPase